MENPRSLALCAIILVALTGSVAVTAADGEGMASPTATAERQSAEPAVIGTVEAVVDGEPHTWYVVSGSSAGLSYASATWLDLSDERRIVVGGFDTPAPPLDTFEWSASGMPKSYGDYEGSTIALSLPVQGTPEPFRLEFPPATDPAVVYSSRATLESLDTSFTLAAGTLEVTAVAFADGLASAEGTFAGTLERMMGEGTVEVTDGRFQVGDVPHVSALRQ